MKDIIAWMLLAVAALGALYAIGLIISYIIMPDDLNDDLDDINCDCYRCSK
jgi:hypothetical protein